MTLPGAAAILLCPLKSILPLIALAFASLSPCTGFAADTPPAEVVFIDHGKVANAFAQGQPLLGNSSYKISAGRRVASGTAELHDQDTDIFYILEGTATFQTGGSVVEPTIVSPGETRGKALTAAVARQLAKGDVIVIPAGVPHQFTEVSGTFLYLVVKVTR